MQEPSLRRIRASAGSGKTYELTTRFLALLSRSSEYDRIGAACAARLRTSPGAWQSILAVTFTNRAASEMRERILKRLKEIALGLRKQYAAIDKPLNPALADRWLDVILRHYGSLNVSTIDSLLCRIVRMASLDLGLPPDFELLFDPGDSLEQLWTTFMEKAGSHPRQKELLRAACLDVLLHSGDANSGVFKGFLAGEELRKKTMKLVSLFFCDDTVRLSSAASLEARRQANIAAVRTASGWLLQLVEEAWFDARALKAFRAGTGLRNEEDVRPTYFLKDSLDECLRKDFRGKAGATAEKAYGSLRETFCTMQEEYRLLREGLQWAPFVKMARLLTRWLRLYSLLQREGRIPHALVARFASRVMSGEFGASEAICRMGVSLSHILVDEFQDTSREQWNVLLPLAVECLSRGGSVTYVGDVKQAIYGWRGGDSTLFDEAANVDDLRVMVPVVQEKNLPTNYRSRRVVVQHNNQVFSRLADPETARVVLSVLMPEASPVHVLEQEQKKLCQAFAGAEQCESGKPCGLVRFDRLTEANRDTLDERVRALLEERIREITARRPYGDIAVLTRDNGQSSLVAKWLLEKGFPVVTENSFLLRDHPLVVELVALLTFLNTPDDDPAFWTLATGTYLGPGRNCSLALLEDWLCSRTSREEPLWQCFQKAFPEIWHDWLAPFRREAGLKGLYDVVSEALHRFATARRFPEAAAFAERFLEVLHLAENQGYNSIAAFLEYWSRHGETERTPMPQGLDSIRIMTMHKAKGLQFPVVLVPWLSYAKRLNGEDPRPVQLSGGISLLSSPKPELGEPYYALYGSRVREELHLLYVTWTRAEDELHVFVTRSDGNPFLVKVAKALELLIRDIPATRGIPVLRKRPEKKEERPDVPEKALLQEDGTRQQRPLSWLPELKIFRAPQDAFGDTAKRRGVLAHRCLELLRLTGDAQQDVRRAVSLGIGTFPAPIADPVHMAEDMTKRLSWFVSLPEAGRWIAFGTPEQDLMDVDGQLYRADRIVNDGKRVSVIDYKTGERSPSHRVQIERYLRLICEAQPLPVDGALVYLDLQEVEQIR